LIPNAAVAAFLKPACIFVYYNPKSEVAHCLNEATKITMEKPSVSVQLTLFGLYGGFVQTGVGFLLIAEITGV
jgi:hypothetical protein